jgi:hypothetical protein
MSTSSANFLFFIGLSLSSDPLDLSPRDSFPFPDWTSGLAKSLLSSAAITSTGPMSVPKGSFEPIAYFPVDRLPPKIASI